MCRAVLTGHTDWVWAVAFDPGGRLLASAGDDPDDPSLGCRQPSLWRDVRRHLARTQYPCDGSLLQSERPALGQRLETTG